MLVIVTMLIMAILGTVLISVSTTQVREAVRQQDRIQAHYLAYYGAKAVVDWLHDNPSSVPTGTSNQVQLDSGHFVVTVNQPDANTLSIMSTGTVNSYSKTVIAELTKSTTQVGSRHPVFDYALFAKTPLTTSSGISIDGSIYGQNITLPSAKATVSGSVISETFVRIHGNNLHPYIGGNICAMAGDADIAYNGGLATVNGIVNASGNVSIGSSGTVNGNVYSGGNVILKAANAKLYGNLHAASNVTLESGTRVEQNVFSGGNISLLNSNSRIVGDVHSANNIYKQGSTYIDGNSWAGGSINQHNSNSINQTIPPRITPTSPSYCLSNLIEPPVLTEFEINNSNPVNVPQSSSNYIIEPGTYGDLYVGGASTVTFKSGNYSFASIDGARWGQTMRFDLSSGGAINIYSLGSIQYSCFVQVSEDGLNWIPLNDLDNETAIRLAGKVYWETHDSFHITTHTTGRQWFGSLLAKNNITTESGAKLIGAYAVIDGIIDIKAANTAIIYAPPTESAPGGGNGGSGGGGNSGNSTWVNPQWSGGSN